MNTDYNLKEITLAAFEEFLVAPDELTSHKPTPEKWSAKEIIGHLIDSASNNHGRFVRAQHSDDLIGQGYDQNTWVEVQEYQQQNWHDLLISWRQLNLQIANLMFITSDEAREKDRTEHNLNRIAFKTVPADQATTLGYFMEDYVEHLKHHLGQVRTLLAQS